MMCGGKGQVNPADESIVEMVNNVRSEVEAQANASYTVFEAVSFRSQVVAGTNFFVKVRVDGDQYVHVRIFRALPCNGGGLQVSGVTTGQTLESDL
jgi:cystatin-A/B